MATEAVLDKVTGEVQTTDATVTTILDITIPTDNSVVGMIVRAVALEVSSGDVWFKTRTGGFRRTSGSAALMDTTPAEIAEHNLGFSSGWEIAPSVSGTSARWSVTGQADKTIDWYVVAEIVRYVP